MAKVPVTIYTTPACVQCESTKRMMTRLGIDYTVEDLTNPKNAGKLAEFKNRGLTQAPIVTTDIKTWSGFKFEKIQSLASYIKAMEK